jgi:hypothetical protein
MRLALGSLVAVILVSAPATAQQQTQPPAKSPFAAPGDFVVKTVTLHHLSSAEAVKLLSPYSQTPGGGVYEVSRVHAITIRETPKIYADMIAVLGQFDREAANVTLNFQLIAADGSGTRDPGIAGLDSLLRGVLKFSGYHLLGTAIATASEGGMATQTLAAESEVLTLQAIVGDLRVDGNEASVHLSVELRRPVVAMTNGKSFSPNVLSTDVTVPIGQTVVLGTAASTIPNAGARALILTVRPQMGTPKR